MFGIFKKKKLMSPHDLKVELQSEQDINNYIKRVSGLNRAGKLVELANVRAAKYNLMSMPSGLNEFDKNQAQWLEYRQSWLSLFSTPTVDLFFQQ